MMPADESIELIDYALEAEEEERFFQRWIHGYQHIMDFEAFKKSMEKPQIKSDEEIMSDVDDIMHNWEVSRDRNI